MQRYLQQIAVSEIGITGQKLLTEAKVLIIGVGGLGTPLAVYLAGAGIGTIGLVDGDTVSQSNMSRQFLYQEQHKGLQKVNVLAEKLKMQNPDVYIQAYPAMLDTSNAREIIHRYDLVCDCTDNTESRQLIDESCHELQIPLVFAAVKEWEGYITVLHHTAKVALNDIFSIQSLNDPGILNCSMSGIINTTCGLAASIQGAEALKIILKIPSELDGGILCFNSLTSVFRVFKMNGE